MRQQYGATHRASARPRSPRRPRWVLLSLAAGFVLAACSPGATPARDNTGAPASAPAAVGRVPAAPASAAAPPSPAESVAPLRLTLNWTSPTAAAAPLWLAHEAGLYREQGLDVELTNIQSTSRAIQVMVAGEAHLSFLDPASSIQATLGGAEMVLLFAMTNRLVFSVMTQPSVRDPAALRGKALGITRVGSASHTAGLVALDLWGIVPDRDVALRQLGDVTAILAALHAGQVEGGVLSPPTSSRARQAGFYELINLGTHGPEYPSVTIGGPRAWVQANEETVRRFARAYTLGIQRAKRDKAQTIEVYRKYMQLDDLESLEDAFVQFSAYVPDVPYVSEPGLARLLESMAVEEPRLAERRVSDFADPRFVRELETSGFLREAGIEPR